MSTYHDELEAKYLGKQGRVVSPKGDWGREFTCVNFEVQDEEKKLATLTVESVDRRVHHTPFDPEKGTPARAEEMPDCAERCTSLNPSWFRVGAKPPEVHKATATATAPLTKAEYAEIARKTEPDDESEHKARAHSHGK